MVEVYICGWWVCPFIDIQVASLLILLCDLSWTPRTKVIMNMSHRNVYTVMWVNSPTLEKKQIYDVVLLNKNSNIQLLFIDVN